MRTRSAIALICSVSLVGLAACGSSQAARNGAGKVRSGFGNAVAAPFEDLNIRRTEIPPVLRRATENPYDMTSMNRCETIAAEVGALDDALGKDMDEPKPPPGTRAERTADYTADTTLDVVRGTATDLVPFRSWVRRLSGANRHSAEVQNAIRAGSMRRSYIKAIGMNLNCSPPAAPSWFVPTVTAPTPKPKARPRRR